MESKKELLKKRLISLVLEAYKDGVKDAPVSTEFEHLDPAGMYEDTLKGKDEFWEIVNMIPGPEENDLQEMDEIFDEPEKQVGESESFAWYPFIPGTNIVAEAERIDNATRLVFYIETDEDPANLVGRKVSLTVSEIKTSSRFEEISRGSAKLDGCDLFFEFNRREKHLTLDLHRGGETNTVVMPFGTLTQPGMFFLLEDFFGYVEQVGVGQVLSLNNRIHELQTSLQLVENLALQHQRTIDELTSELDKANTLICLDDDYPEEMVVIEFNKRAEALIITTKEDAMILPLGYILNPQKERSNWMRLIDTITTPTEPVPQKKPSIWDKYLWLWVMLGAFGFGAMLSVGYNVAEDLYDWLTK